MIVPYYMRPEHPDYEYNSAQTAIWNLCLELDPRYILDIGTLGGTSARLAARYLGTFQRGEGQVVTLDVVAPRKPIGHPLVTPVQVWPYGTHGLEQYGDWRDMDLLPDWEAHIATALDDNTEMVWEALQAAGGEVFDFAYVDGDHSELGLWLDLQLIKRVTKPPHYALLDDVYMPNVPAGKLYQGRLVHEYGHYDFDGDGWDQFEETRPEVVGMPRMALVWEK